jgi:hypothetical protein
MLFFYRRLLFAFVLAYCQVSVVLQVQLLIYCSLGLLIYLVKWMPMESKRYNFVAIFNECVLLVSCYMLMLFTEYVPVPEIRYYFGYDFLYILYFNFGVNVAMFMYEVTSILRMLCKRKLYHRKLKLELKKKIINEGQKKEVQNQRRENE